MASFTASSDTIWFTWANQTITASTTTITATQVWDAWSSQICQVTGAGYQTLPAESAVARKARREDWERKLHAEREARQKAREKARELLLANLTDSQREEFEKQKFFHVETRDGQRRYRLSPGALPIRVQGEDGRRISYCIHCHAYPAEDEALAFKLMLEANEEEFLRIANATVLAGVG